MFVLSITFVLKIKWLLDMKMILRHGASVRDKLRLFSQIECKYGSQILDGKLTNCLWYFNGIVKEPVFIV